MSQSYYVAVSYCHKLRCGALVVLAPFIGPKGAVVNRILYEDQRSYRAFFKAAVKTTWTLAGTVYTTAYAGKHYRLVPLGKQSPMAPECHPHYRRAQALAKAALQDARVQQLRNLARALGPNHRKGKLMFLDEDYSGGTIPVHASHWVYNTTEAKRREARLDVMFYPRARSLKEEQDAVVVAELFRQAGGPTSVPGRGVLK